MLPLRSISIHALREEGDDFIHYDIVYMSISIHALREEGDIFGEATENALLISIHALREEGDSLDSGITVECPNFYPRPPRGGRPKGRCRPSSYLEFLSTPSARRATEEIAIAEGSLSISIHALREEGDRLR